jgi:hypothetical protein
MGQKTCRISIRRESFCFWRQDTKGLGSAFRCILHQYYALVRYLAAQGKLFSDLLRRQIAWSCLTSRFERLFSLTYCAHVGTNVLVLLPFSFTRALQSSRSRKLACLCRLVFLPSFCVFFVFLRSFLHISHIFHPAGLAPLVQFNGLPVSSPLLFLFGPFSIVQRSLNLSTVSSLSKTYRGEPLNHFFFVEKYVVEPLNDFPVLNHSQSGKLSNNIRLTSLQ